jgi:hypothetical protein
MNYTGRKSIRSGQCDRQQNPDTAMKNGMVHH